MITTTPTLPPATTSGRKPEWRARALVVVASVGAALAVWSVSRLAGVNVAVRNGAGGGRAAVGPAAVAMASAAAGVAGWALFAALERWFASRAHTTWITVALAVLLVSLAGPLAGGASAAAKAALACIHVAVAAALIPGMWRRPVR